MGLARSVPSMMILVVARFARTREGTIKKSEMMKATARILFISLFAGLFLVSLLIVAAGGGAQRPSDFEKPVWTMEFIRVKPGMFGLTLSYLNDNGMRVREEAKRQGAVLSYHRIAEQGSGESDRNIVLLTEFKNPNAYDAREKLFASIRMQLPNNMSGMGPLMKP
jgi:hypothetical protein